MCNIIKTLLNRVIDISYNHKLSHISSCITSLPIIFDIYKRKKTHERFVLSNGHAGLALYVVLEYFYGVDAEQLLEKHGIHPCFDKDNYIDCSTGSLGLGLPIAVGYALSDKNKKVYCMISDGESFEGSVWESLNFISRKNLTNIEVHINANGYSAYDTVDLTNLENRLKSFYSDIHIHNTHLDDFPFLRDKGMEGHYYVLRSEEEKNLMILK